MVLPDQLQIDAYYVWDNMGITVQLLKIERNEDGPYSVTVDILGDHTDLDIPYFITHYSPISIDRLAD